MTKGCIHPPQLPVVCRGDHLLFDALSVRLGKPILWLKPSSVLGPLAQPNHTHTLASAVAWPPFPTLSGLFLCCYAPPPRPNPQCVRVGLGVGGWGGWGHNGSLGTANRPNAGAVSGSECPCHYPTTSPSILSMEAASVRRTPRGVGARTFPLQSRPAWDRPSSLSLAPRGAASPVGAGP